VFNRSILCDLILIEKGKKLDNKEVLIDFQKVG